MKHHNLKRATFFSLGAALAFSIMALFIKLAAPKTNNYVIIFIRFGVSFLYVIFVIFIRNFTKNKITLKTNKLKLHILRSLSSVLTMLLFYYSLRYITLLDANLLLMTSALFVPIIGLIFFRYKSGFGHWSSVIIGFIGVFFVLNPTHELFNPKAFYALFAGISAAVSVILIRILVKKDNIYTCLFYYFLIAVLISGIMSIFYWQNPGYIGFVYLIFSGVAGTIYQDLLIRASYHAPAKIVSSLMYTSLIFTTILGLVFLNEKPTLFTILGMILISFGGILTVQFAKIKNIK